MEAILYHTPGTGYLTSFCRQSGGKKKSQLIPQEEIKEEYIGLKENSLRITQP